MVNGKFYTSHDMDLFTDTESVVYMFLPVNRDLDWEILNGVSDALSRIFVTD